jgi:DNA-binding response OmpR family regulator
MAKTLILEAEAEVRDLIGRLLATNGYQVVAFAEAEKALTWARSHPLDLAIVSLDKDGPSTCHAWRALKETSPDLKVLVISRFAAKQLAKEAVALGAEDYLLKPVDIERLEAKVVNLLQRPDGTP